MHFHSVNNCMQICFFFHRINSDYEFEELSLENEILRLRIGCQILNSSFVVSVYDCFLSVRVKVFLSFDGMCKMSDFDSNEKNCKTR